MRVRSGRFIAAILMAGYALAAGNTSPCRVQRHAKVRLAPPCGCDVRSFSPCGPTMTSADFCVVTARVTARRAVLLGMVAASSSHAAGSSPQRLDLDIPVWSVPGLSSVNKHRMPCRSPQVRTRTVGAQAPHLPQAAYRWASLSCASLPGSPRPCLCGFCPSPRTSCAPASSRQALAALPLPSARGYPCSS